MTHLLSDTDELVALHGEGVEPDVGRLDPHIGELKRGKQITARYVPLKSS